MDTYQRKKTTHIIYTKTQEKNKKTLLINSHHYIYIHITNIHKKHTLNGPQTNNRIPSGSS